MQSDSYIFLTSAEPTRVEKPVFVNRWLPVVLLLGVFCVESTAMLGADRTSGPLHAFTHAITGARVDGCWSMVHHLIRKTGHFFGYGMLSLAWLRALMLTLRPGGSWIKLEGAWRVQITAVAATFVVAGLDELHQSFLPNRTGKFSDVLLDTAGALTLQLALRLGVSLIVWFESQRGLYGASAETAAA